MQTINAIAVSRLVAQQRATAVAANNLANANTPGYKTEHVLFTDWLSAQAGSTPPGGVRTIAYAQDRATWRDQADGALTQTGNPLDLAMTGPGYFTVQSPSGPRLTRAGRFGPAAGGAVADANGDALLDVNGQPIRLSPADTSITVAGDGTVSSENGVVGKIGVVRPQDPMQMTAEGGRLLKSASPTAPVAAPHLVQGAVEESNVSPVLETTRMTEDLRSFQFMTQVVQAEQDRQQAAIDKILPSSHG